MRLLCFLSLLLFAFPVARSQTINPAAQIDWPKVTGSWAPTLACTSGNFGQPYTDVSRDIQYVCSASGWTQVGPCTASGPFNAKTCGGAYGDLARANCNIPAGSKLLSCTKMTRPFTVDMVGEPIYVADAGGTSGSPLTLETTIAAVMDGSHVTLSSAAAVAPAAALTVLNTIWGHDDTEKLTAAYAAAKTQGRALYIPGGNYLHHGLNFTGSTSDDRAQRVIYGDAYGATNLWAIAVTDPDGSEPHPYSVGVDLSSASETKIYDLALFGGGLAGGRLFADVAPAVNVFCARQAQTGGNALSILHSWNNVYTETSGPYDVVWDGCEQTNMVDSHFQVDSNNPVAALYLTNVNTPKFASPWVPIIAPGVASGNTMTKLSISGGRTSFIGKGNMVVLDEGSSNGIFQLSFEDGYANMNPPAGGGACSFISDTAPNSSFYVRTLKMDHFYIEGTGQTCTAVNLTAQAIQWTISGTQRYPTHNTVPNFQFKGGFLSSYAQVDGLLAAGNSAPVLAASTCKGSILQFGPMNTAAPDCSDYAMFTNMDRYVPGRASNGTSVRPYPFPSFPAVTWVKLGTWKAAGSGDTLHLTIDSTGGEQSKAGQQGFIEIAAASGNTQAAPNVTGISGWVFGTVSALVMPSGLLIAATDGATAAANDSWDIWVQEQPYSFGTYRVIVADRATWTPSGVAGRPPAGPSVVAGKLAMVTTQ